MSRLTPKISFFYFQLYITIAIQAFIIRILYYLLMDKAAADSDTSQEENYSKLLREKFSALPYNELRKEAKANSISGRLKKVDMIEALVRQLSLKHGKRNFEESSADEDDDHPDNKEGLEKKDIPIQPVKEMVAAEQPKDNNEPASINQQGSSSRRKWSQQKSSDAENYELNAEGSSADNVPIAINSATSQVNSNEENSEKETEKSLSLSLQLDETTDGADDVKNTSSDTYIVEGKKEEDNVEDGEWISDDQMEVGGDESTTQGKTDGEEQSENTMSMLSEEGTEHYEEEQKGMENTDHGKQAAAGKSDWDQSRDSELSKLLEEMNDSSSPKLPATKTKSANSSPMRSPLLTAASSKSNLSYNRFAMIHAKEFGGMPSLAEYREHQQQRHEEHTSAVPAIFKRLASPKKVHRPFLELKQHEKEKQAGSPFHFGQDLPTGVAHFGDRQSTTGTSNAITPASSAKRYNTPRVDVKSQTKAKTPTNMTPSFSKTTPLWNSRINKLATPKGQKIDLDVADEEASTSFVTTSRSYTPHRGPYKYVDTTKMSDREFALYEKERMAKKMQETVVQFRNSTPNNETSMAESDGDNEQKMVDNNPFEL